MQLIEDGVRNSFKIFYCMYIYIYTVRNKTLKLDQSILYVDNILKKLYYGIKKKISKLHVDVEMT